MTEDRFEDVLKKAAQDYNRPPQTPSELMWARIEATRRERARQSERSTFLRSPWIRWGLGLAAALLIGIGIGRFVLENGVEPVASGGGPEATVPSAPPAYEGDNRAPQLAYRLAATEHLTRAETFLTSFRSSARSGAVAEAQFWSNAGELLSSTRLLLDSPAAQDPVFRSLLEDLELVLVQIAGLPKEGSEEEVELVNEGLETGGLLPRLRTAIPAGPAVNIEGAL
jgi:hypothetical protein